MPTPVPAPTLRAAATDTPSKVSFTAAASIDLEAKAADGTPKLPTFKIKGYTGAVMNVASFYSPVIVDLGGLVAESQVMPALLDHDTSQIVGQTNSVEIGSDGVDLAGVITGEDETAAKVKTHAKNGFQWQASIGANIVRREFLAPGEKATVNGREVTGPLLIAREARLFEISFVALGADSSTSAAVAATVPPGPMKGALTMQFEQWLQAKGVTDPAALSDSMRTFLRSIFDQEQAASTVAANAAAVTTANAAAVAAAGTVKPGQADLESILSAHRAEDQRIEAITGLAAAVLRERPALVDDIDRIAKAAIEARSTVQEVEIQFLRLRAGTSSAARRVGSRSDSRSGPKVIEAAICMGGRLENIEKKYDEATLNAASDRYPHGLGLCDLLLMVARENGYSGTGSRDVRGMLEYAFGRNAIRAEFSTLSLPGILSNVANKFLLMGFNAIESGWRDIATIRNVKDFKTNTSYSLSGGMTYDKVGPAGELKHATVGETTYTVKADTYGKIFAITRQDIINDDLGALTQVPSRLGRGAATKLNDVFWTEFMATGSPTFWAAGHANVSTGAGSALSSAGLTAAQLKFRKQTDPDGLPLGILPKLLLVPPELEITANELMTSLIVNTGGSSTTDKVPNNNVWQNKYKTVVSTYLSNASYTNYSAAAWWLIADPADMSTIEVAFLNGRETPVVESADAEFDTLGIAMRGYHDWGTAKQEYRASVRSAGS